MNPGRAVYVAATLALLLLDQSVKAWARAAADGVEGRVFAVVWHRVLELKLVYNEGVAFGLLQGAGQWLAPVALAIAGAATYTVFSNPAPRRRTAMLAALLAAGALGNMVDRLVHGKVTDMFFIRAINFPVFNVADMCITVAACWLVAGGLAGSKPQAQPAETSEADGL